MSEGLQMTFWAGGRVVVQVFFQLLPPNLVVVEDSLRK